MASLLFKEMKGVNFSCVSPASAAVCTSIDRRSMVQPSIGRRSIDRRSPHLRDLKRPKAVNPLSQNPSSKPKSYNQKSRKSSDHRPSTTTTTTTTAADLVSPANSSRYLLDDAAFFEISPDLEVEPPRLQLLQYLNGDHESSSATLRPSSSTRTHDQVVVLRVSLHCKGCEGKVRKHISRMEGVTSFDIDLPAKKVTVIGNVTPLGVLNSVSKVKNAQFWPSPPRASASF